MLHVDWAPILQSRSYDLSTSLDEDRASGDVTWDTYTHTRAHAHQLNRAFESL